MTGSCGKPPCSAVASARSIRRISPAAISTPCSAAMRSISAAQVWRPIPPSSRSAPCLPASKSAVPRPEAAFRKRRGGLWQRRNQELIRHAPHPGFAPAAVGVPAGVDSHSGAAGLGGLGFRRRILEGRGGRSGARLPGLRIRLPLALVYLPDHAAASIRFVLSSADLERRRRGGRFVVAGERAAGGVPARAARAATGPSIRHGRAALPALGRPALRRAGG